MKILKSRFFIAGLIIFIILFSISPDLYQRTFSKKAQIKKGNFSLEISLTGKVRAEKEAKLSFKTTGRIIYLPFKENENVSKGQIVVSLDKNLLQSSVRQAEQDFIAAKAEVEKVYDETGRKVAESYSEKVKRTDAERGQNKAYDKLRDAQQTLIDSNLYAPFDGLVAEVNGSVGEWTSALSGPIITIVDFSTVYFEGQADPEDLERLRVGETTEISLDSYKERRFRGEVMEIGRITKKDEEGDLFVPIKIRFIEIPENMIYGIEGEAKILSLQKENILLLPRGAMFRKNGKTMVKIISGLNLTEKEVNLGNFDGQNYEILDGLSEGNIVILSS